MIANEMQTATLSKLTSTLDAYGQRTTVASTKQIEVFVKTASETLTRDARYADIELIALTTDTEPAASDGLTIGATSYSIERVTQTPRYLMMYLRKA